MRVHGFLEEQASSLACMVFFCTEDLMMSFHSNRR